MRAATQQPPRRNWRVIPGKVIKVITPCKDIAPVKWENNWNSSSLNFLTITEAESCEAWCPRQPKQHGTFMEVKALQEKQMLFWSSPNATRSLVCWMNPWPSSVLFQASSVFQECKLSKQIQGCGVRDQSERVRKWGSWNCTKHFLLQPDKSHKHHSTVFEPE